MLVQWPQKGGKKMFKANLKDRLLNLRLNRRNESNMYRFACANAAINPTYENICSLLANAASMDIDYVEFTTKQLETLKQAEITLGLDGILTHSDSNGRFKAYLPNNK